MSKELTKWLRGFDRKSLDKRKQARLEQRLNKPLRLFRR